jgi:hypothetical protein
LASDFNKYINIGVTDVEGIHMCIKNKVPIEKVEECVENQIYDAYLIYNFHSDPNIFSLMKIKEYMKIGAKQENIRKYIHYLEKNHENDPKYIKKCIQFGIDDWFDIWRLKRSNIPLKTIEKCAKNNIRDFELIWLYSKYHTTIDLEQIKKYSNIPVDYDNSIFQNDHDIIHFIRHNISKECIETHLVHKTPNNESQN